MNSLLTSAVFWCHLYHGSINQYEKKKKVLFKVSSALCLSTDNIFWPIHPSWRWVRPAVTYMKLALETISTLGWFFSWHTVASSWRMRSWIGFGCVRGPAFFMHRGWGRCVYLPQYCDALVYGWMYFMGVCVYVQDWAPYPSCQREILLHSLLIAVYGASALFIKMQFGAGLCLAWWN